MCVQVAISKTDYLLENISKRMPKIHVAFQSLLISKFSGEFPQ